MCFKNNKKKNKDFLEDPVRAKLLAFQIFTDIENFKFQMRSHDYILLTALYIFINYGDYLIYKDNCNFLKFLSKTPYFLNRLKKYPSWTTHVSHAWEKISKDIETISKKKLNSSPSKNEKFGWETDERETCEKSQKVIKSSTFIFGIDRLSELPKIKDNLKNFKAILACYTVIHMFENNEIYGSELYWIETYNHSTTNLPKYMTLGVNFTGLSFLSLSDKKVIKKIGFSDIFEAISQPKSLLLRLKNENYRFNTFKSFEICQIIEEYKLFRKVYHLEE